jgi:[ribosomal protein S5]-alanine N-acetyltransferase
MNILETARLRLRSFVVEDAAELQRLVSDWEIAKTTLSIPYPYPDGLAEKWIASHETLRASGEEFVFAVVRKADDLLVGCTSVRPVAKLDNIGYWIGRPYWGNGYATEAAHAVMAFAFKSIGLEQLTATHLTANPASGRVLQKLGMRHVGSLRVAHTIRDEMHDLERYLLRRSDFVRPTGTPAKTVER